MMAASPFESIATVLFAIAILHTFLVKKFQHLASKYPEGSVLENVFHLLGEVEVVFGFWAAILILSAVLSGNRQVAIDYLNQRNFTEPMFVFVIMVICSTKPILNFVEDLILFAAKKIPLNAGLATYFTALTLGPLLGSFVTEPAAMTVTALFLLKHFYSKEISQNLKYATLGLLFVNVSIGGTLTPFAAPPVLMVAGKWGWDLTFMLSHFGFRAVLGVLFSTGFVCWLYREEISKVAILQTKENHLKIPNWVLATHLLFLGFVILCAHHIVLFFGIFLFFLGLVHVTKEYQQDLKLKESLLVAFFLGGLVVFGGLQEWWLRPTLSQLSYVFLYFGSAALTSITDNAALTYLGSQVAGLSDLAKYSLVAGSVVGGGLTVIANAPNPAGYSILSAKFGVEGISPGLLFKSALMPTLIALLLFYPW